MQRNTTNKEGRTTASILFVSLEMIFCTKSCRKLIALIFFSSPAMESFMRDEKLKATLENRYRLKCACNLCTNGIWSPLVDRCNLKDDPQWNDAIAPLFMNVIAFRKLSLDEIEKYEEKAIDFIRKYNDRHPARDTISMQELLHIMWNVIASPY